MILGDVAETLGKQATIYRSALSSGVSLTGRAAQASAIVAPAAPVPSSPIVMSVRSLGPDSGGSFLDSIPRPALIGGGVIVVLAVGLIAFKLTR